MDGAAASEQLARDDATVARLVAENRALRARVALAEHGVHRARAEAATWREALAKAITREGPPTWRRVAHELADRCAELRAEISPWCGPDQRPAPPVQTTYTVTVPTADPPPMDVSLPEQRNDEATTSETEGAAA
jgi:hypothetical protein